MSKAPYRIFRVDFCIPQDDPCYRLAELSRTIQTAIYDEYGMAGHFKMRGAIPAISGDVDDFCSGVTFHIPNNAQEIIEEDKPRRFHVEGLETRDPESNYLPEGTFPPYIIHDCQAGEPLPMSFRSRIEALNFAQHLNDNPPYFAPSAYRFTSKNTDADLDGTPAVIYQIDGYGNYELRYICGSTLVVFPPNVVTL